MGFYFPNGRIIFLKGVEPTDTYSISAIQGDGRSKKRRKGGGREKVETRWGKLQNEERAEERMFGEVDACLSPQAYIQDGHATPRMFSKFVCW